MPRRSVGRPPRDWLADAASRNKTPGGWDRSPFGRVRDPEWAEASNDLDLGALLAAQNQHLLALQIRDEIRRGDYSTEGVAEVVGMNIGTLRGILSGRVHVSLTDLHRVGVAINREFRSGYMRSTPAS